MDWRPRVYWALLALAVATCGAVLTLWITHVDTGPRPHFGVAFDEPHPFVLDRLSPNLPTIQIDRFRIPRVVMMSLGEVAFIVTPMTRSVVLTGLDPRSISCGYLDRVKQGASAADWVEEVQGKQLQPIAIEPRAGESVYLPVPARFRSSLARIRAGQGAIKCTFSRPVAAAPTFTERTISVRAQNGSNGAVILDVSALEDIDDLRFTGGLAIPFAGERTRLLDSHDNVLSAEWSNVAAQEQRDIILVTIGALAAIAAATAIEAIRPFVERESGK